MTIENKNTDELVGVELNPKQQRVKDIITDLKDYMNTYPNQMAYFDYADETIIDDVIYGLGIALDKDGHSMRDGFEKFKKKLVEHIIGPNNKVVGVESDETITIPVETLKRWRTNLSQGDVGPRWEIETLLQPK